MSDEALIAELERQREAAREWLAYYEALQEGQGVVPEKPKPDISEVTAPILTALATHPVFGPGRNIFFAHKQLNLYPYWMPEPLLRVMLSSDAPSAVAWLHRLFKIERADLRMVALVHGLEVQQPVSLSNGVHLLPLTAGPDSTNFRVLARQYQGIPWSMDIAWAFPPTIAVFDMGTVAASADPGKAVNDNALGAILDAARAFTLIDRAAPVVGTSWTDFVNPELTAAEVGQARTGARFEGSLSQFARLKVDDESIAWAERYLRMSGQLRRVLDIALDRLNLARRRRSPSDQAIDGGICLEALLSNDNQELTYKLQLRAALLLGTALPERQEIRKAVRDLYSLRSKVVHGRARQPEDTLPDAQIASRGLEICTRAVRAVVQLNAPPDFPTWELTGGLRDNEGS
jgi:Apea-like HEPN